VTLTYQKVDANDLILEDWKRYLDLTEKAIFESELSDYDWYSVVEILTLQNGSHFPPKNGVCADLDKNAYASYCAHEKHCYH
jgi:hypothetical protein